MPEPREKTRAPSRTFAAAGTVARTADGLAVPVLDITHPAFATHLDATTLPGEVARFVEEETRRQRTPQWLTALFLKLAGQQSWLIRAMAGAKSGYLPALTTYFLKLGPANLMPPLDNDIDRRIVASLAGRSLRLRLGQVAGLPADALAPQLAAAPGVALHLLNIAGGPAMDSLNALILLQRRDPQLLQDRRVIVEVLDIDPAGPTFRANALTAFKGRDGPLAGVDAELRYVAWDWRDLPALASLLAGIAPDVLVAASSEGGLFEYGRNAEIIGCLRTLAAGTGPGVVMAESVTRNDPATLLFTKRSLFPIIPRGADAFGALAAQAGWRVAEVQSAAFADQVLLRKAG